ncbi:hypothetical protein Slin15195_G017080 [Septoria linicola]|uniref:Gfo/Idh/MocA-like oxidoreductase C-terminal domain-containing protein n=1 Tax=Septoria linicola TaxID=215465 RepID=A0A9Q9EFZ3_9PEZI|nr:hypothetical protein Slin15195_G017080 [Septoria linicola]
MGKASPAMPQHECSVEFQKRRQERHSSRHQRPPRRPRTARRRGQRHRCRRILEYGGKIAYFYSSRMMAAGQQDTTEIIGTHGKIVVNGNPQQNLVELHESSGIRKEVPQTYYDRFEQAFVTESNEFTECILDGKKPPFQLAGAISAVKIGEALQRSLRTGKKIEYNDIGEEIVEEKARL